MVVVVTAVDVPPLEKVAAGNLRMMVVVLAVVVEGPTMVAGAVGWFPVVEV